MLDELVRIVEARPYKLTLLFDQSRDSGNPPYIEQFKDKLRILKLDDICGLIYKSQEPHAKFLLVSKDPKILAYAKGVLLDSANIPEHRLVEV